MRIAEDNVWRYYNCPDPRWSEKCRLCREKVTLERKPVAECINCWKVEIWKHGTAFAEHGAVDFDRLMDMVEMINCNSPVVAKASRAPIQVVRTGVPESGYPDLVVDDLLVLYAESISEREVLRSLVQTALDLSDEAAAIIPIRRGCWRFDSILGPWQEWYPENSDLSNQANEEPGSSEKPGASPGRPSGDGQI